jgi:DNA-binding PadR family transcriptional regulator
MNAHHKEKRFKKHHGSRKRSVSIPRGFLDYVVLQSLTLNQRSGTELMDEIEQKTHWRPSPGSIYPLLKKLNERGLILETVSDEPGLKRFTITDNGKNALEEQKRRNQFKEKFHSFRRIWLRIFKEMDEELYEVNMNLFEAVEDISKLVKTSPDASGKIREILERATMEIKEIRT